MAFTREQTLSRLKKVISEGRPIIDGGQVQGFQPSVRRLV